MKKIDGYCLFLALYFVAACILVIWVLNKCMGKCFPNDEQIDTVVVEHWDTAYIEKHDTIPVEKRKEVLRYVTILLPHSNSNVDTLSNELRPDTALTLPVVQKVYFDDSTYTAYVSGVEYEEYPRLDSINVRSSIVTHTIKEIITIKPKKSRWSVGIQGGYGWGFRYKGFEPYVGVGIECRF